MTDLPLQPNEGELTKRLAEENYEVFRVNQDQRFESDFEKEVQRIEKKKRPMSQGDDS